jgi:hypothetical protein
MRLTDSYDDDALTRTLKDTPELASEHILIEGRVSPAIQSNTCCIGRPLRYAMHYELTLVRVVEPRRRLSMYLRGTVA